MCYFSSVCIVEGLLGPELLTHYKVNLIQNADTTAVGNPHAAEKLSKRLKRKSEKIKLTKVKSARWWAEINHAPQPLAEFMAMLETMTADKREDRMKDTVEKVTGPSSTESGLFHRGK